MQTTVATNATGGHRLRRRHLHLLLLLLVLLFSLHALSVLPTAGAMKKSVHVPDDLDDVMDEEEDEEWREWGKRSSGPKEFDPPPDFEGMNPSQIQHEMMKRQFGPVFGFVKLRLGVPRKEENIPEIATRWAKLIRTASMEAKFTGIDLNTIMFSMERGQDAEEFKDFVLSQPEAYEVKIGDQLFRRDEDPPLEEVIETLKKQRSQIPGDLESTEEKHHEDEL